MKLLPNICLDEISDEFKNRSCRVKNLVTMSNARCRGNIFSLILMKLGQDVCLDEISTSRLGHVRSKSRSLGHILEKPCVRSRDLILIQILMKLGQNVCFDDFLDKFEIKVKYWNHCPEGSGEQLQDHYGPCWKLLTSGFKVHFQPRFTFVSLSTLSQNVKYPFYN